MNYYATSLYKNRRSLLIAPVAAALIIAGCGGGGSAKRTTETSRANAGAMLRLAQLDPGKALVDGQGRTLYLFEADKGDMSTCNGACASIWPPATTTGKTTTGPGLAAGSVGATRRGDGGRQLTYHGHPLYRYAPDTKPGDVNGQGLDQFGGKWYVLGASGSKIDDD